MRHQLMAVVMGWAGFSVTAQATILPPNELYREDRVLETLSNIDEESFNAIIQKGENIYAPVFRRLGASLVVNRLWEDSTVNAAAYQNSDTWYVSMYGGLARRPEITPDAFTIVFCHEVGHHIAGFPFGLQWAANEGQSDYFASQECAKSFWGADYTVNARARYRATQDMRDKCDSIWSSEASQNLCYRTMLASQSIATLFARLGGKAEISLSTPDRSRVSETYDMHPDAQCRLDTYSSGALCTAEFAHGVIPGKDYSDRYSIDAEREAANYSCTESGQYTEGLRPRCWYKPRL